jgi:hypothetical protein
MTSQQQRAAAAAAGAAVDRSQPDNNDVLSLRKENSRLRQCNQQIQEADDAEIDRCAARPKISKRPASMLPNAAGAAVGTRISCASLKTGSTCAVACWCDQAALFKGVFGAS